MEKKLNIRLKPLCETQIYCQMERDSAEEDIQWVDERGSDEEGKAALPDL